MSKKRSKRYQEAAKLVTPNASYSVNNAIEVMKSFPAPKFDPSVTVSFHLTVDPRKSDQMVRGSVTLPHGTGKNVRVLVFAQGDAAKEAEEAGAEFVGLDDLIEKVQNGFLDFETVIASHDVMKKIARLSRILGPRGMMPNPKTGTVTNDVAKAVKEVKAGRVNYKIDKSANISAAVGKLSFDNEAIAENIKSFIYSIVKARPASAKGAYIQSATISCAMCPGLLVDTVEYAKL
ncbi:MAG: 50S ribosomal protein L1 [Akkermansia sp.]